MPWIINENNEFEYKELKNGPKNSLNATEVKDLSFIKGLLYKIGNRHKALYTFLFNECLKPITFNVDKADGSQEETVLSSEETPKWLNEHKNVFSEAGREPACHLLAFAIKNGLTLDDINLLMDNPGDSRCAEIRQTLERSRKEFFESVGSEDTRISEGSEISVREEKLVNFFTDYLITMSNHLENIKNSNKTDIEKSMDYENIFMQYQSLALQSLELGRRENVQAAQVDWMKLLPVINRKLSERGAIFNFDNIADFGRLSQLIAQAGNHIKDIVDRKEYENNLSQYRTSAFADYLKISYIISYLTDNLWHSNKSSAEFLKGFGAKQMVYILDAFHGIGASVPGFIVSKDDIPGLMKNEDMRSDLYLDDKLSKFSSQTVSENFETELHTLANSFGDQRNSMDPNFNDMIKGLVKLSDVYKDSKSKAELKLTALRYAQLRAAEYLDSHPDEVLSDTPKGAALLAEKIFTLAGTQKLAMRGNLQPGALIKGSAEYKNHDLSIENMKAIAPVKVTREVLKANRYKSIMKKHANGGDVLPEAKRHIQEETSADYSRIEQLADRKNVPVHSGLGKQNRLQGGYNLEFVCAGSSNIQMAKTYKGETGRNELGKVELKDDPAAMEIVNSIRQKYDISFDEIDSESRDNSKYEFALEQDYGRPMYLDGNKVLHEEAGPESRIMPGIRKLEKGTTTRYNISGAMEKIWGLIGKPGYSNSGDHSIDNNKDYMIALADKWLSDINEKYQNKINEGRQFELKPINIMFKGHSRGGVAANEASMMVNHLVEHKYPQLREFVHISTQLLDPVPGLGSNLRHPEVDLSKGDYNHRGRDMRGLKATPIEKKNNTSTVFYGLHSNNNIGFAPQNVLGADRVIFSCMTHDTGVFDAVDGHKGGYLAENGEEYRGSGLNELPHGLYFIDENKNIVSCRNSQEAHKAIDAMLGRHAKHSRQNSRHGQMHDIVDAWFKSNPEVITTKDTRYPVEQAMQADKKALQKVLDSFDNTRAETELAADPNEILTRAISSLFAHQLLLDQMKSSGKRIYPESAAETGKLLAESEESGLADKIRNSEDFRLFYDSLNKADIKVLASANSVQLRSYLNNYKAIASFSTEAKRQVNNENLALRSADQVGRKNMFFEKHIGNDGEWKPPVPNRINLSADRTALNMIAVARLLKQGYSLKDIMDPFSFDRERQAMGDEVLHDYITMTDDQLAESAAGDILAGFERSLDEIDAVVGQLDNLSAEELSKPGNAYILRCRDLITNFGQELGRKGQPVFEHAIAKTVREGRPELIPKLFKRQLTGNLVMHRIEEAQNYLNSMVNHPESFDNPDEALTNVCGAAFTVMGMGTRFRELKALQKDNFKFSEAFGAINETDIEICKNTIQFTEIYGKLREFITKTNEPEAVDRKKLQKLGTALQSGKLFDGKIRIQENGMGFAPIDNVDELINILGEKSVPKRSERQQLATEIYNNSRQNIANYEQKLTPAQDKPVNSVQLQNAPKPEDPLKGFLTEKIREAMGTDIDKEHFEETLEYFVTYGDDNNRNRMFTWNEHKDRIGQIREVLENGGKVFITLPDNKYHTMDTSEIVFKNGKPKLEIPKREHDAMTISIRGINSSLKKIGDMKDASPEFNIFKQKVNEIAADGIPKDTSEYFKTLNDLSYKAFYYAVTDIDSKLDSKHDACVTAASQIIEIYRAVCMHEKASRDGMNLSMIASKFYKTKLANDIKSGSREAAERARDIIGNYDKYCEGIAEITGSKNFRSMFDDMSSKEIEQFAHKNAADITKFMTESKARLQEEKLQK